jgi:ABC-type bacteriocin/lantibiotic exporter with double-glycine peptidase domain
LRAKLKKGGAFFRCPSLLFLNLFLVFSCAGSLPLQTSKTARIIPDVPFYPQQKYQCGPASLAGVLNYWGVKDSPEEIARHIFSPTAGGTLDLDMVLYAQRKGLKAIPYGGSWEDVRKNIDSRVPLILLVDEGFWVYQKAHFLVVVGYDEKGLIVNSGKEQHTPIPLDRFLKIWEKTKFWTLRVTPQ